MKKIHGFYIFLIAFICAIGLSSFIRTNHSSQRFKFLYKQAGLTEMQAAAHLVSRFTYGAKNDDIDNVVKIGLENWFEQQLAGNLDDKKLNGMLAKLEDINLSNTQVENLYPRNAQIVRFAIRDGVIHKDSVDKANKKEYRDKLTTYMKDKGYKPQQNLYRQFINQKILRSAYSNNQLRELMTDFWFNHFNVSLNKNQCASYVPAYERDVIRPNVFGNFENILVATAKSPAMLMYLDNFSSTGINDPDNDTDKMMANAQNNMGKNKRSKSAMQKPNQKQKKKGKQGLNENYAREVMELHTLGVDGGYTQSDVTQAARILTGWTLAPMSENGYGSGMKNILDKVSEETLRKRGFVHEGDFLFAMNRHDNGEKIVLGKKFPAGGGYEEGMELLKMLAHNRSTAKFISKKIATRFVSDNPPQSLIDKMTKTFLEKDGNITEVLITMASAPEFWTNEALREKTKSPFELAMSAVRSLDAKIIQPYQLYSWVNKMGQQMYYYQAPTGFPDKAQYWINTGSLLNRMNFGLALASQRIPGISFNLASLNNNHEPESAEAALLVYSKLFMPERDLSATINRLKPMLKDPNLVTNVAEAASKTAPPQPVTTMVNEDANLMMASNEKTEKRKGNKGIANGTPGQLAGTNSMLSQVVGVIIGSPEYQRK